MLLLSVQIDGDFREVVVFKVEWVEGPAFVECRIAHQPDDQSCGKLIGNHLLVQNCNVEEWQTPCRRSFLLGIWLCCSVAPGCGRRTLMAIFSPFLRTAPRVISSLALFSVAYLTKGIFAPHQPHLYSHLACNAPGRRYWHGCN